MADLKTKPNDTEAGKFINSLDDPQQAADSLRLVEIMSKITGKEPVMWGTSIVGFDSYHYKSERSSQEGDWPVIAFSPRKGKLSLYLALDADKLTRQFPALGKYKTGKGCIYITRLSEVNEKELTKLIKTAYANSSRS